MFKAIKNSDYKSFDLLTINSHFNILNFIFKGLEFLDNSTLNVIPYEIISCLELALEDWVVKDKFIIATTLSNKYLDFHFDSNYSQEFLDILNNYIQPRYSLHIEHRLIKISLPKNLSRDYLSCVVLYHELGHFIDYELNISKKILLNKYFVDNPIDKDQEEFLNHTMEYFADLFASQYIDEASNLYLNYIAFFENDSHTHPATSKRISVVNEFISGAPCSKLDEFNNVLTISGHPIFTKRYKILNINKSDFLKLIPQTINSKEELHYIFKLGWEFWNNSDNNFLNNFKNRQKYHIINNLIEKSISNYTVLTKWQEI